MPTPAGRGPRSTRHDVAQDTSASFPGPGPHHRDIVLYDTTLRDGMQREGMSVSVDEKIRIAKRLASLGIHIIEAGFPGSNPKDAELFRRMESLDLGEARVSAFGMTRGRGVAADADPVLRILAESWAPVACIVGKTWDLHVEKVLKVDRAENLRMIAESVAYLCAQGKDVVYDAEHFFDAYAAHPDYALECVRAAAEAGADTVVLCDTNGATLPPQLGDIVAAVVADAGRRGAGWASTPTTTPAAPWRTRLVAVERGAVHVQGTINGYGERCGNADLCAVIPSLKLKMGLDCISDANLARLTDAAHYVAELCNVSPDPHQPYVGRNAFAHKGGLHVAGVAADPRTFEHIVPDLVGNVPHILVSELSGKGTIRQRVEELGYAARRRRANWPSGCCGASSRRSTRATTTKPPTPRSSSCSWTSWGGRRSSSAWRASASSWRSGPTAR